ncbi:MAG: HD domain-containing phosphohydrolase [Fimbriimonadaceae bacterium]
MTEVGAALVALAGVWAVIATTARVVVPWQLNRRVRESLRAFSVASELRFPAQRGVSDQVVFLVGEVGRRLRLSPREVARLQMAARLRGIGLCAVPYRLLNGREPDSWSPAEQAVFRRHTEVSGAMLELLPPLRHLAETVRESPWPNPWCTKEGVGDALGGHAVFRASGDELGRCVLAVCSEWVALAGRHGRDEAWEALRRATAEPTTRAVLEALEAVLRSSRAQEPQARRPARTF